jgi:hypothetical protein
MVNWKNGVAMRSNGHGEAPGAGVVRTADALSHVRWQTDEAIALPIGAVRASGDAKVQVRSPQRLAAIGDVDAQIGHIQRVIVEALAGALVGMEPTASDLNARRDEIASLALVAANMKLGAVGVALLDLRIGELMLSR